MDLLDQVDLVDPKIRIEREKGTDFAILDKITSENAHIKL